MLNDQEKSENNSIADYLNEELVQPVVEAFIESAVDAYNAVVEAITEVAGEEQ